MALLAFALKGGDVFSDVVIVADTPESLVLSALQPVLEAGTAIIVVETDGDDAGGELGGVNGGFLASPMATTRIVAPPEVPRVPRRGR